MTTVSVGDGGHRRQLPHRTGKLDSGQAYGFAQAPTASPLWIRCRGPRQYRFTAGQRCPSYRRAISDTKFCRPSNVVCFETGGSPGEAAVCPTFGCGRPKCRIFVSQGPGRKDRSRPRHHRRGRPTPSIDDDPVSTLVRASRTKLRAAGHQDLITVLCSYRSTYSWGLPYPVSRLARDYNSTVGRRADRPRGPSGAMGAARDARRRPRWRPADLRAGWPEHPLRRDTRVTSAARPPVASRRTRAGTQPDSAPRGWALSR